MAEAAFDKRLAKSVAENDLFPSDARIVVGVSGGPDSVALLQGLVRLNRSHGYALDLHVAHLNHSLRGVDSDEDAAFVEAMADDLRLPRTIEARDVPAIMEKNKGSLEETARRVRYDFFERVANQETAGYVALGHHANDNAETILHRIIRGTGLRGVCGIRPSRPLRDGQTTQVVRPLLPFGRTEIIRFLDDEGIAYREDHTNRSVDTTRNKIRNQLLPMLESEFNPQVVDALLRLSRQACWTDQYISQTVDRLFNALVVRRTDQDLELNAHALARRRPIVQAELLRAAIGLFGLGEQDLTFDHIGSIIDMVAAGTSGKKVSLPGGMTAGLVYDRLVLSMPTEQAREQIADEVSVHLPGRTVLPVRGIAISCEMVAVNEQDLAGLRRKDDRYEEWLDPDNVHPPLTLRSRRDGDRFWPLGAPGNKRLSDFFSDLKVDPKERDQAAILCDQLGPIWIVGYRIDDRVRLTAKSRSAIRIRVQPLDE